jgi:opacity protein-like surface antigen
MGLILALFVATGWAAAQVPHFGGAGSITMPTGDYHLDADGNGFNAGWQGMAFVDLTQPDSRFGLRVNTTYGHNKARTTTSIVDQRAGLLGFDVDVTYDVSLFGSAKAYALAGIGVYWVKLSMPGRDSTFSTEGWNGGGGVRQRIGSAALFLEARYCRLGRVLNEHRYYAGTFYRPFGLTVQQVSFSAGIRFGRE